MKIITKQAGIIVFTLVMYLALVPKLHGQTPIVKLNDYFSKQNKIEPINGVVVVQIGGNRIPEKAFGCASVEYDLKNSLLTKFAVGSITKTFIATSILLLQQNNL